MFFLTGVALFKRPTSVGSPLQREGGRLADLGVVGFG